jgi:hypothetical protein
MGGGLWKSCTPGGDVKIFLHLLHSFMYRLFKLIILQIVFIGEMFTRTLSGFSCIGRLLFTVADDKKKLCDYLV